MYIQDCTRFFFITRKAASNEQCWPARHPFAKHLCELCGSNSCQNPDACGSGRVVATLPQRVMLEEKNDSLKAKVNSQESSNSDSSESELEVDLDG